MADIGYFALVLALGVSIYSAIAFALGIRKGYPEVVASARHGLIAACGLLSLATAILAYALVTHEFQIAYVASYTSRGMSLTYLISALWAGNTGSLLFWGWLLSLFALVVMIQNRGGNRELVSYASAVVMAVVAFFVMVLLFAANPFDKLSSVPADGVGLNPLLENPGMLFHPPTLLAGYVGFTIPFAFAIAALITGRLGDEWIRLIRRWTLLSWVLLSFGTFLGAQWAYVELGWGGYWGWDPVENAGFMPWLVGTAFLHSIMMQRRRGMLKLWNMVLIILTFTLSIFGTYLTRSGILSSVHTFSDSTLGHFFLSLIGVTLVGSLLLLLYRRRQLKSETEMDSLVSRESTFLLNNLLLVGIAFAVFVGTIFPLISEAVRGVKVSVSAPFFNQVTGPIFLLLIVLMGICPLISWRRASINNLLRNFLYPLLVALILGVGLVLLGVGEWYALLAFSLCGFAVTTIFLDWGRGVRARHRVRAENYVKAFFGLLLANKSRYGGYIVHIAIILIAVGIVGSSFYQAEKEAVLAPGESMTIKGYTLTYEGWEEDTSDPDKGVQRATLTVYNGKKRIGEMTPEKYFHRSYQQPVTEVAIRSTPKEDLYVVLGGLAEDGTASFRVLVNPLVFWIWTGGTLLVVGGLIAFWPSKRERGWWR
ncbi:MAG: heme lyase CcmF/NrfE family subunit [Dehalococcoidia bacterium]